MTAGVTLEQTVLGHALNDPECFQLFTQECEAVDFNVPNHKVLAHCLIQIAARGMSQADEDTLQLVVASYPEEEKDYGGAEYVRTLKSGFQERTGNYGQIVIALKLQSAKTVIGTTHLEKILKAVNNPTASAAHVREALDAAAASLEKVAVTGFDFTDASQMSHLYSQELDARVTRPFYTTGISALDELLTEGFLPKNLTVMAGFTGMAKSTISAAMAHRIACQGIGVGFFSMEMKKESVWDKLVSSLTQIPVLRLKKESAELNTDERSRIERALEDLAEIPLLINDRASMSMSEMRYQILSAKRRSHDLRVIFIDLFGKLEDVDSGENLAAKIQQKCKEMRVMAQELDVHFVMVVQIGRQGYGMTRGGIIRRPILTDIKNANAYAEEPDNVFLLHRNKYYIPDLEDDVLELHVAKQRDGEAGTVCYLEMFADRATLMATHKRPHDVGEEG